MRWNNGVELQLKSVIKYVLYLLKKCFYHLRITFYGIYVNQFSFPLQFLINWLFYVPKQSGLYTLIFHGRTFQMLKYVLLYISFKFIIMWFWILGTHTVITVGPVTKVFLDLVITKSSQRDWTGIKGAEGIEFHKSSFGDTCELFRSSLQFLRTL